MELLLGRAVMAGEAGAASSNLPLPGLGEPVRWRGISEARCPDIAGPYNVSHVVI